MAANPTKDLNAYVQSLVTRNSGEFLDSLALYDQLNPLFKKLVPTEQRKFLIQSSGSVVESQEAAQLVGTVLKKIVDGLTDEDWSGIGLQNSAYGKQEVRYEILEECSAACEKTERRRKKAVETLDSIWEKEDWMARLNDEGLVNEGVWSLNFSENLARLAKKSKEYNIKFEEVVETLEHEIELRKKKRGSRKCDDLLASDITYARQALEAKYEASLRRGLEAGQSSVTQSSLSLPTRSILDQQHNQEQEEPPVPEDPPTHEEPRPHEESMPHEGPLPQVHTSFQGESATSLEQEPPHQDATDHQSIMRDNSHSDKPTMEEEGGRQPGEGNCVDPVQLQNECQDLNDGSS